MYSKKWNDHRLSARIESFSVSDKDNTIGDDNNESGDALTINYQYQLNKHTFIHTELTHIDSHRPSRIYHSQPAKLRESQLQVSLRYFF